MNLSGKVGIETQDLRSQGAAQSREAGTDREGGGEDHADIDAETAGDPRIVHRGPQPAAEAGLRQNVLQHDHENPADGDDEAAVEADLDAENLDAALEPGRDLDHLLLRSHGVVDGRDRHEDQADGEQHLVEMAARIELLVERPLEHEPDDAPARQRPAGSVRRNGTP